MEQEILVYAVGIATIIYIFWRIFRKKKNPDGSCHACKEERKSSEKNDCDNCPLKRKC